MLQNKAELIIMELK
jgi:hypothetical protein